MDEKKRKNLKNINNASKPYYIPFPVHSISDSCNRKVMRKNWYFFMSSYACAYAVRINPSPTLLSQKIQNISFTTYQDTIHIWYAGIYIPRVRAHTHTDLMAMSLWQSRRSSPDERHTIKENSETNAIKNEFRGGCASVRCLYARDALKTVKFSKTSRQLCSLES